MDEIVKYELSDDRKGLKAFSSDGRFYHIHSNEMNDLEKQIHSLLLKVESTSSKWVLNTLMIKDGEEKIFIKLDEDVNGDLYCSVETQ